MPRTQKPAHYRGTYHVDSRRVREAAKRNPETRCWRCGLTIDQVRQRVNPRAIWTSGHVNDGETGGPMLPECSPCNYGNGARLGNRKRKPRTDLSW